MFSQKLLAILDPPPLQTMLRFGLMALPFNILVIWALGHIAANGLTINNSYFGRDFVNYWSGGHLAAAFDVSRIYDVKAYQLWLTEYFHPNIDRMNFSYPPHSLLLLLPFGLLPYHLAYALWIVFGAICFWYASFYRAIENRPKLYFAVIATSSVFLSNLLFGQLGLFLAGMFVGGLRLLPQQPILAGLLLGMLSIKPQLVPLLAIVLLMRLEWKAIASACISGCGLMVVSILMWGIEPWQTYLTTTVHVQAEFLRTLQGFWVLQLSTPYGAFHYFGASNQVAMILQGLVSVLVILASVLVLLRKDCPWSLQATIIALAAVMITPYLLSYDLTIPLAALLWYLSSERVKFTGLENFACVLFAITPLATGLIFQYFGLPLQAIVVAFTFAVLLHHALQKTGQLNIANNATG